MRQTSLRIKEDTYDRCFICNIERDDFDKLGLSFTTHCFKEHFMWNYLFFRVYLIETDPTEMTGQETYVYNEMINKSIRFYPLKKAMGIEGRNKVKKDLPTLFDKVMKLHAKVKESEEDGMKLADMVERVLTKVDTMSQDIKDNFIG
jgi:hypothetical protein